MRVAVIDDQHDIADMMRLQLGYAGVNVVAVLHSAAEARSWDGWPDVDAATIDYMLPSEDGVAVARWLGDHHPHVRPVIVTAAPESLLFEHPSAGLTVVPKPFDIEVLTAALRGEG